MSSTPRASLFCPFQWIGNAHHSAHPIHRHQVTEWIEKIAPSSRTKGCICSIGSHYTSLLTRKAELLSRPSAISKSSKYAGTEPLLAA